MGVAAGLVVVLSGVLILTATALIRERESVRTLRTELESSEKKRTELTESYARSQAEARKEAVETVRALVEEEAKAHLARTRASECEAEAAARAPAEAARRRPPSAATSTTQAWAQ